MIIGDWFSEWLNGTLARNPCGATTSDVTESLDFPDFQFDDLPCNCTDAAHAQRSSCAECEYEYDTGGTTLDHSAPSGHESDPLALLWDSLPIGVVYLLVFVVGTCGNLLVVFVVSHFKNMRNVTNIFLASLSTADLCLIWFCVPIQVRDVVFIHCCCST